ncbi:MAG: Asp-tRNA(Asn)/Glu-tRNA(Gln) amidotransferase GatCAB subunit A [Caldiserica bacterium]|nr:MAG: Asp-tRNA(Asn)/Glu-tRNA(Gln) amidotransferase GatCAB subunit A [Caldisericota bacterium]
MSIKEIVEGIKNKKIKAKEVVEECLKEIRERDKGVNSFITVFEEDAIKEGELIDRNLEDLKDKKLLGVPISIKDNILVKGKRTTAGSKILENYIATYDATVVKRLKEEGAIIIGKTNMDEFAFGSSTETSYFGPTRNPVDIERVPGGSSGGSAASVSAGFVPCSLGSDTGGSIRQPASFCGVFGLKPTYGRVSRYGLIAFASSLDQIGPFAKNTFDLALIMEVIAGYDEYDSTSLNEEVPEYSKDIENFDIKGVKIGLPDEYFELGVDSEIKDRILGICKKLEEEGSIIERIKLPHTKYAVSVYYIVAPSEASSNLARYDGVKYGYSNRNGKDLIEDYFLTRRDGFGEEAKRRIIIGTFALSSGYYDAYYLKAQKVRTLIKRDFEEAFKKVDFIITPTSPQVPFKIGEILDPISMYMQDVFTIPASLAGIPGLNFPAGRNKDGLPIGLQILGKKLSEREIFCFSFFLEKILEKEVMDHG